VGLSSDPLLSVASWPDLSLQGTDRTRYEDKFVILYVAWWPEDKTSQGVAPT
jgi:hypothetical protein